MIIPKRQLLTLIFTCLCLKKSLLINISNAGNRKGLVFVIAIFLRILNSFDAIFRQETSTTVQQDKCLFAYLLLVEIFFCYS